MMKEKIIVKVQVEAEMFQVNVLYLRNKNPEIDTKISWDTPHSTFLFSFLLSALNPSSVVLADVYLYTQDFFLNHWTCTNNGGFPI